MSKSMLPFILREPFVGRNQDHPDESVYEFFRRRLSKEVCLYFTANEYIWVWTTVFESHNMKFGMKHKVDVIITVMSFSSSSCEINTHQLP